jgi:hypothetical protein
VPSKATIRNIIKSKHGLEMPTNVLPVAVSSTTSGSTGGVMTIASVYWYQPQNVGDLCILEDDAGSLIWKGYCEVANQSQVFKFPNPFHINGYQVPTLGSGTLYLYRI